MPFNVFSRLIIVGVVLPSALLLRNTNVLNANDTQLQDGEYKSLRVTFLIKNEKWYIKCSICSG